MDIRKTSYFGPCEKKNPNKNPNNNNKKTPNPQTTSLQQSLKESRGFELAVETSCGFSGLVFQTAPFQRRD